FDRLVRHRNRELGHGASGQRGGDFYARMGRAILAGVTEVLGRCDVLAGRRLVLVADVRLREAGGWLVDRRELHGEGSGPLPPLALPESALARLPRPGRMYLERPGDAAAGDADPRCLHPLLVYDADAEELLFLNARRGQRRAEYLGYGSGRVV